jgi:hypothetical protein
MKMKYGTATIFTLTVVVGASYAGVRRYSRSDSNGVVEAAEATHPSAANPCPPGLIDSRDAATTPALPQCEDRVGDWYEFHDQAPKTAMVFDSGDTPGVGGKGRAVHALGSCENATRSATVWGAGFGFDLNNPDRSPQKKRPYDALAHGFRGIRFKARAGVSETTEGAVRVVSVRFPDVNTDPLGGHCVSCWDDFSYSINLDTKWRSYTILWNDLVSQGTGLPARPFAANAIFAVHWRFLPGDVINVYIDDVEFVH